MTDREERQHVIEVLKSWDGYFIGYTSDEVQEVLRYAIASIETDLRYDLLYEETSEQADKPTTKNNLGVDAISRKAVQTRLKEIINEMETIFADIREREVNDSVCGLCEYDCDHGLDGFANECPGFEKDDCFKLNEKYRAEWLDISNMPSVTPQEPRKITLEDVKGYCEPRSLTIISNELLYELTHPKIKALEQEPRWIPVSERLPKDRDWYLGIFKEPDTGWINSLPFICYYVGRETKATTKEFWILRGFTDRDDECIDYYFNLECVAWMPLPKSYREEEE